MEPVVTVYAPERRGDRWIARAEVRARGELVQLSATASDRLARQAADWYHRGAAALHRWVQFRGVEPGAGVFGELGELAAELAVSDAIPADPDLDAAAALLAGCLEGEPGALEHADAIVRAAGEDTDAARALELLAIVDGACSAPREAVITAFAGAARGDPHARALLGALHAIRPPSSPVRLGYHVGDYLDDGETLRIDLREACRDEFGARIIAPHGRTSRRVRPSLFQPMLRTFQLAASYRGPQGAPWRA